MKQVLVGSNGSDGQPSTASPTYNHLTAARNAWGTATRSRCVIAAGGTLKNFMVSLSAAPGAGKSYTFTVRNNGSGSSVTVTIADLATSATDSTHTLAVVAGDSVDVECAPSGTPSATNVYTSVEFDSTNDNSSLITGGTASQFTTGATTYNSLQGGRVWVSTETAVQSVVPTSGTFRNLHFHSDLTPSGGTFTMTLMLNGSPTSLSATIPSDEVTGSDTSNSVALVAGDLVSLQVTDTDTPTGGRRGSWGLEFVPTIDGESLYLGADDNIPSSSAVNYNFVSGANADWQVTEANRYHVTQQATFKKLYVLLDTAPGAGTSRAFTFRDDTADTALTCTISDTATANNDTTHEVTPVDGSMISIATTPSGSPANTTVHWGLVGYIAPEASSGFSGSVSGVTSGSIVSVCGVVISDIASVSGV